MSFINHYHILWLDMEKRHALPCPSKPFEILEIHQGAWDFSDEEEFSDDEEKASFLFQVQDLGIEISNAHGKGSCLSAL